MYFFVVGQKRTHCRLFNEFTLNMNTTTVVLDVDYLIAFINYEYTPSTVTPTMSLGVLGIDYSIIFY